MRTRMFSCCSRANRSTSSTDEAALLRGYTRPPGSVTVTRPSCRKKSRVPAADSSGSSRAKRQKSGSSP